MYNRRMSQTSVMIFNSSFLLAFLCMFTTWTVCYGACNKYLGPTGSVDCISTYPRYDRTYQWATCLTDAYIKQKSGGKHACIDQAATYCYYQCMLEEYGVSKGPVYSGCECSSSGATGPPLSSSPTTTVIPEWCLSPDGSDCSWYKQCLEKKYPCEGTPAAYATTYAEKFCHLYTNSSSSFSSTGKKWINAVRKCLQVSLVPLLRPWQTPSCQKVKIRAFASHTLCYLQPYKGAPSVCDLPVGDWWKIFWTIKNAFAVATVPSLKGMLGTVLGCGNSYMDKVYDGVKVIVLNVTNNIRRTGRAAVDERLDTYAGNIADSIAKSLGWRSKGIGWFAYVSKGALSQDQRLLNVSIILADKLKLDVNYNMTTRLDLNQTVYMFADAVRKGMLRIRVRGASGPVRIRRMYACEDVQCKEVYMVVTAASAAVRHSIVMLVLSTLYLASL